MNKVQSASKRLKQVFYVFHPFGLFFENLKYKFSGRPFESKYLITSFLLYGGLPGSFFSRFQSKPKKAFTGAENLRFGEQSYNDNDRDFLKRQGYLLYPSVMSEGDIEHLLEFSLKTSGSTRQMDSGNGLAIDVYFDRKNPRTVRFDYAPNDLIKDPVVQKLVADPTVLRIAQDYLGTLPILDFVAMWWHVKSPNPDKEAAQYFHFDMERLRWIKFFFYITDVNPESGPHIFVPRTQADSGMPFGLRKKGYTRLEDNEVSIHFPVETWKEFIGPKGSMIVEDTRGLHKGKHVTNGDRLVFQIQFTSSLFGADPYKLTLKNSELGTEFKSLYQSSAPILQNILISD